jgi:exopolyphosphatase/guanosine-5'-triphosphate,3'-diphosphate pyrophosphatase
VRVAAVDTGTNSTRLLVADVEGDELDALMRRAKVTRLGEGVDEARRLAPAAIERVHAVLDDYAAEIEKLGAERTRAVGTSSLRDAADGEEFMRDLQNRYGWETKILTGDEEAELTRRGVGATGEHTLVVDVGGGSTELIAGSFRQSLDVGSVRLTERFFKSDPPSKEQLEAAGELTHGLLPDLDVSTAIGVAGTVTQLHELAGDLTLAAVEEQLERLAALPLAERRQVQNMDPDRAPVIVAGAVIVREVLRRYGLDRLEFSERDLLDGIALEVASA